MKIISFAWTTEALLAGKKSCTRRCWSYDYGERFKTGDIVQAYDKSPRFGGKQIAIIEITAAYWEYLQDMPKSDLEAEGGLWDTKEEFIALFPKKYQRNDRFVRVLRFKIISKEEI